MQSMSRVGSYWRIRLERGICLQKVSAAEKEKIHLMLISCPSHAGKNSTDFWASTLSISKNQKYLWATTRSRQSDSTGYISGYLLASDGSIGERLFLQETSTSGGTSSAVSASLFSDDYFALTDSSVGFVEVWKMQANGTGAGVVSRVMLEDGGCCANEVWLS